MFKLKKLFMAPEKGGGGGGGQKGSTAVDDTLSDEDLATRGGEEDLADDKKGGDRGDDVEGGEAETEEGEGGEAKKGDEEEESDDAKKGEAKKGDEEEESDEEESDDAKKGEAKKGKADAEDEEESEDDDKGKAKAKKGDDKGKAKGHMIPKQRYDSLRARHEALLRRIGSVDGAEEEGGEEDPTAASRAKGKDPLAEIDTRLEAIDEEFDKAAADNNQKKMRELRKEERKLNQARTEFVVGSRTRASSLAAVEQIRYDQTVKMLETQLPWLDPDHEQFDEERAADVDEMTRAFEARGYKPSAALMRSIKYFSDDKGTAKEAAEDEEVEQDLGKKGGEKKKTDVTKNLAAAKKVPPSMKGSGADSDAAGAGNKGKIDAARLTDKEFDELPATTKSRLRGDEV